MMGSLAPPSHLSFSEEFLLTAKTGPARPGAMLSKGLRCYVMEGWDHGRVTVRFSRAQKMEATGRVLDCFEWLEDIWGRPKLENHGDEGYCGCNKEGRTSCVAMHRVGGEWEPMCALKRVFSECAAHSHLGRDCGNKRIALRKFPKVRLACFRDIGLGLQAEEEIAEGVVLGPYTGVLTKGRSKPLKNGHQYAVTFDEDWVIDAANSGSWMRYVNTSCCGANVKMERWQSQGLWHIVFVATCVIPKHATIWAERGYGDSEWKGTCKCRGSRCQTTDIVYISDSENEDPAPYKPAF